VIEQSRQEFDEFRSRPPVACPVDGEPLTGAPAAAALSGTELRCRFDGWSYPRDHVAPQRPA
jgi:hypothetical protein